MSKEDLKKKFGVETSDSSDNTSPANENNPNATPNKYYRVDLESPYVQSLKVILRDGEVFYMPYSLQPIIRFFPEKGIIIKMMDDQILIEGRNLIELLDMLGNQKVKWIRESSTGKSDGSDEPFIKNITITETPRN